MKPGIQIDNDKFIFTEFPTKEIGLATYCKSFKIDLKNIIAIVICPRLALDDEELFILIIDYQLAKYPMPSNVLQCSQFKKFEEKFALKPIIFEWSKFEYDDHYRCYDKIIFPNELYWQDLFKNDFKLKFRKIIGGLLTKNFWGTFSDSIIKLTKTK